MFDQLPKEQQDQILDALVTGQTILAIKIYREVTNCNLETAKQFIHQLIANLEWKEGEKSEELACLQRIEKSVHFFHTVISTSLSIGIFIFVFFVFCCLFLIVPFWLA